MSDKWFFYVVDKPTLNTLNKREFIILEQQPYGSEPRYRLAFKEERDLPAFEDKGRTSGWWQSLFGSGVYHNGRMRIPPDAVKIAKKVEKADIHIVGETWQDILSVYNKLKKENPS
jgi:hypothetical protein